MRTLVALIVFAFILTAGFGQQAEQVFRIRLNNALTTARYLTAKSAGGKDELKQIEFASQLVNNPGMAFRLGQNYQQEEFKMLAEEYPEATEYIKQNKPELTRLSDEIVAIIIIGSSNQPAKAKALTVKLPNDPTDFFARAEKYLLPLAKIIQTPEGDEEAPSDIDLANQIDSVLGLYASISWMNFDSVKARNFLWASFGSSFKIEDQEAKMAILQMLYLLAILYDAEDTVEINLDANEILINGDEEDIADFKENIAIISFLGKIFRTGFFSEGTIKIDDIKRIPGDIPSLRQNRIPGREKEILAMVPRMKEFAQKTDPASWQCALVGSYTLAGYNLKPEAREIITLILASTKENPDDYSITNIQASAVIIAHQFDHDWSNQLIDEIAKEIFKNDDSYNIASVDIYEFLTYLSQDPFFTLPLEQTKKIKALVDDNVEMGDSIILYDLLAKLTDNTSQKREMEQAVDRIMKDLDFGGGEAGIQILGVLIVTNANTNPARAKKWIDRLAKEMKEWDEVDREDVATEIQAGLYQSLNLNVPAPWQISVGL